MTLLFFSPIAQCIGFDEKITLFLLCVVSSASVFWHYWLGIRKSISGPADTTAIPSSLGSLKSRLV